MRCKLRHRLTHSIFKVFQVDLGIGFRYPVYVKGG